MRVYVVVDDLSEGGLHGLVIVVVEGLCLRGTVASWVYECSTVLAICPSMKLHMLSYLVDVAAFNRIPFLTRSLIEAMVDALFIICVV